MFAGAASFQSHNTSTASTARRPLLERSGHVTGEEGVIELAESDPALDVERAIGTSRSATICGGSLTSSSGVRRTSPVRGDATTETGEDAAACKEGTGTLVTVTAYPAASFLHPLPTLTRAHQLPHTSSPLPLPPPPLPAGVVVLATGVPQPPPDADGPAAPPAAAAGGPGAALPPTPPATPPPPSYGAAAVAAGRRGHHRGGWPAAPPPAAAAVVVVTIEEGRGGRGASARLAGLAQLAEHAAARTAQAQRRRGRGIVAAAGGAGARRAVGCVGGDWRAGRCVGRPEGLLGRGLLGGEK
jgi:hypothetical protein